ncbi:unnamed protein product [Meganyctiphanes norvegica]|uniref:C2H2-type domain-containing protein n=1 Tax=Meganyctiphanes norvegica TaxID=48144 RepID=A0AAV2SQA4_MEGNR
MYPFQNNPGLMNWQYYQNGNMGYSAPFQPSCQPGFDMTSPMQNNLWQTQVNYYSSLMSLVSNNKGSTDNINLADETDNNVSTWQDANISPLTTTLSPEPQINSSNCDTTFLTGASADESPFHSTVNNTFSANAQINKPISMSYFSGDKVFAVSPNNTTHVESIVCTANKPDYSDQVEEPECSSNIDEDLDIKDRETSTKIEVKESINNAIINETSGYLLNFVEKKSVNIFDSCTKKDELLSKEGSVDTDSSNIKGSTDNINLADETDNNVSTWQDVNISPLTTTLSPDPQINSSNCDATTLTGACADESPLHSTVNTLSANAQINKPISMSSFSGDKVFPVSPNNTTHVESIGCTANKPDYSESINNAIINETSGDLSNFVEKKSVNMFDICTKKDELLSKEGSVDSDSSNNAKEIEMLSFHNNVTEFNEKLQLTNSLEDNSTSKDTNIGFPSEAKYLKSDFEDINSQNPVPLLLHLKRACDGIWVVKNRSETNSHESSENNNIEMYDIEKTSESYYKIKKPSKRCKLKSKNNNSKNFDEKCFECKICFKIFSLKTSLNNHMVTHSNLKPFLLQLLWKTF